MRMRERIGKRINNERVDEALRLDPDIVSTACPFCLVMLTDSVNGKKAASDSGSAAGVKAKESIHVVDVAQLLLDSVNTPVDPGGEAETETETESEPEPEPVK
jgi:Fe-S oxidoreductase